MKAFPNPFQNGSLSFCRKNLTRVLVVLLFTAIYSKEVNSQSPLWTLGNKAVKFEEDNPLLAVSSLPTPTPIPGYSSGLFYNGAVPQFCQNATYDSDGNLRLFVIDGRVYNKNGYLILDSYFTSGNAQFPVIGQQPDIIVTALPGSCNKYLIIGAGQTQTLDMTQMSYSIIDLSLINPNFPGLNIKGAPISTQSQSLLNEGLPLWTVESDWINEHVQSGSLYANRIDPFGASFEKSGAFNFEIVEGDGNSLKFLFVAGQQALTVLKIGPLGVLDGNTISFNNEVSSRSFIGEMEATFDPTSNNILIAVTASSSVASDNAQVQFMKVNPISLALTWSSDITPNPPTTPSGTNNMGSKVYGIEFSPNARALYFSQEQYPYYGYIQIFGSSLDVAQLPYTIPNFIENFGRSRIEKNRLPGSSEIGIYFAGNGNLGHISNCDDPQNSIWNATTDADNSLGTLPSYHNAYGSGEALFKTLPVQNHNGTQIQAFLEQVGCCSATSTTEAFGTTTITDHEVTWTNGNNPFENQSTDVVIEGDLIFESGAIVIIQGMTFRFSENSNVIIKPGAAVRLNNSVFTSFKCSNNMWLGVDLLGQMNVHSQPPFSQLFLTAGSQGVLHLTNNSEIQNAMIAVEVGTSTNSLTGNTGGLLVCQNSTFRNNQSDVRFKKFHAFNSNGVILQNKSRFENVKFITDAPLNNSSLYPQNHCWLMDVDKVRFINCTFANSCTIENYSWGIRGVGILAQRASFIVDGNSTEFNPININIGSSFYGLTTGIKSSSVGLLNVAYICKEMYFQKCLYGIINYETDYQQIYSNHFVIPQASNSLTSSIEQGIQMKNSTGFFLQDNDFTGESDPNLTDPFPCGVGIWVENCGGASNYIKSNRFDHLAIGIEATKRNRDGNGQTGLQFLCNINNDNLFDIFLGPNSSIRTDQGGAQPAASGSSFESIPAFNLFSNANLASNFVEITAFCELHGDFIIDENQNTPESNLYTNYYYKPHDDRQIPDCGSIPGEDSEYDGDYSSGNTDTDRMAIFQAPDADAESTCAFLPPNSNLSTGLLPSGLTVQNKYNVLQQALSSYHQTIDNDDTKELIQYLANTYQPEQEYLVELMAQSYPLSDDVLKSLLDHSETLDDWHLTEILIANCPINPEILEYIKTSGVLSPFFYNLVRVCTNQSLRRTMEMEIASKSMDLSELIKKEGYLSFGLLEQDSCINFESVQKFNEDFGFEDGGALSYLHKLMSSSLQSNDSLVSASDMEKCTTIFQILNAIDFEYSDLDETRLDSIREVAFEKDNLARVIALSILQESNAQEEIPNPLFPSRLRMLMEPSFYENEGSTNLLNVYPNTVSSNCFFTFPQSLRKYGNIEVFTLTGQNVAVISTNDIGIVEFNSSNLSDGLYLITLSFQNKVIGTQKLIVSKK
jgi:hypothetical protein